MTNISEPIREQMAMLEDVLEGFIGDNLPPLATKFIMNNPMYNKYLSKVEDTIITFMDEETGMVEGKQAHQTLSMMFPNVSKWISIPRENFYIKDMVNEMAMDLVGKEVL